MTVLVGVRYGQREKIFDAVIDKVEVKQISELSPREIEHDNPEIRRADESSALARPALQPCRLRGRDGDRDPLLADHRLDVLKSAAVGLGGGALVTSPDPHAAARSRRRRPGRARPDRGRARAPLRLPTTQVRICTTAELEGVLDQAEADGADVAVALASGEEGADLLARMRGRFPTARRGLLIPWLGWSRRGVGELVLRSMARGWIDLYVIWHRPGAATRSSTGRSPSCCRSRSAFAARARRARRSSPSARSPRAHQLRSSLAGLGIPHRTSHSGQRAGARGDARRRPGADRSPSRPS